MQEDRSLPKFPTPSEVPPGAALDGDRYDGLYLIEGKVLRWDGPREVVRSPICLAQPDGSLEPALVGHSAKLDAPAALRALDAAVRAWDHGRGPWPTARVADRLAAVARFAHEMRAQREPVVRRLMWEIGKTRKDAEGEFDRTIQYIFDTIEAVKELDRASSRFQLADGYLGQIRRTPLGVTLCMGPFNYPLNETYTTLIPALIMGNTIVSKLPRFGALAHAPLLEPLAACFPPGVVNVVQGDGPTVVGPMMTAGHVDVLAFIGTSRVANLLERQHPRPNRLRTVTGLEAKNPAVVLPCADLALAVRECVAGALSFNGQRCTAIKVVFVHRSIADAFVSALSSAVDALPAGMPWDPGVQLTPLPEPGKPALLSALVADAVSQGAAVTNAGDRALGTFYRPAVVYPVTPSMRLYREEQFGPVIPVAVYDEEREIDAFMRESPYGQQIALFGRDRARVASLVDALVNQVCRINLNSQCRRGPDTFPFTGRKDSAEGTLSVTDALRQFSIRTVVACQATDENKSLVQDITASRASAFLSTDFLL
jgi:glyceraldehyde-3-phosphate dehydrogenase (NADP+)